MGKTRFKDRQSGENGPVIGALHTIQVSFGAAITAGATHFKQVNFPAGMKFRVTNVVGWMGAVVSACPIQIGTTAAGVDIVASVALTTGKNTLTVIDHTPVAGGLIDVRIIAAAGDTVALPVDITITGYVMEEPTGV